jgi:hypothetical protein
MAQESSGTGLGSGAAAAAASPLAEASPASLDDLFSSRPPFDPAAMRVMIAEFRRMRVKWASDEAAGVAKKAAKRAGRVPAAVGDLWEGGGE